MHTRHDTIVIGAGQAGLAASWWLIRRGVDHAMLEGGWVADRWRAQRWDTFRLLQPELADAPARVRLRGARPGRVHDGHGGRRLPRAATRRRSRRRCRRAWRSIG